MTVPNIFRDLVRETSETEGTAAFELLGAASGHQSFDTAYESTETEDVPYKATDGIDWEVGEGTFTPGSPPTLSRDLILATSADPTGGSPISFGPGTKTIEHVIPAAVLEELSSGGAAALDDLSDVDLGTPQADDVLKYSGTEWVAGAVPGGSIPSAPLTGATILLEADQAGSYSGGDPVGQWDDLSGGGLHLTAAGSVRPTYREEDVSDGLPYIEFDGSDDILKRTGIATINPSEYTGFLVFRSRFAASAAFAGILSMVTAADNDYDGTDRFTVTIYNSGSALAHERGSTTRHWPFQGSASGATYDPLAFEAFAFRHSTVMGTGLISLFRANMPPLFYGVATAALAVTRIALGGRHVAGADGFYARADIRHFSFYPAAKTDYQIAQQLRYLANQWGVPRT